MEGYLLRIISHTMALHLHLTGVNNTKCKTCSCSYEKIHNSLQEIPVSHYEECS